MLQRLDNYNTFSKGVYYSKLTRPPVNTLTKNDKFSKGVYYTKLALHLRRHLHLRLHVRPNLLGGWHDCVGADPKFQ